MKKIIYMGTPEFAVPGLMKLWESNYEVILAVTQPDKAKDRGKKIQFSPIKNKALELGVPVEQPESVKDNPQFINKIRNFAPDLIVVAAYGKILPKELLDIPKYGCINIHGSILPKYRGAAPIHHAVIDGEEETGVTIMDMAVKLDAGDILSIATTKIKKKTTAELHEELALLGADLLLKTIPDIFSGNVKKAVQDEGLVTYAPMVFKSEGHLDFNKTADELERLVRGMNSWPGTHVIYMGTTMKVLECHVGQKEWGALNETDRSKGQGVILSVSQTGIEVGAKVGTLVITKIQMPGKKAIAVSEYLKGNKIESGMVLQ